VLGIKSSSTGSALPITADADANSGNSATKDISKQAAGTSWRVYPEARDGKKVRVEAYSILYPVLYNKCKLNVLYKKCKLNISALKREQDLNKLWFCLRYQRLLMEQKLVQRENKLDKKLYKVSKQVWFHPRRL